MGESPRVEAGEDLKEEERADSDKMDQECPILSTLCKDERDIPPTLEL